MESFFIDSLRDVCISWQTLLERLATPRRYSSLCQSDDAYTIVEHIIVSMLAAEPIVLMDYDMSPEEQRAVLETSGLSIVEKDIQLTRFDSKDNLLAALREASPEWSITLFTSGTTGRPKRVSHSFASITRAVRRGEKHCDDVWGLAYNTTHMAGIQVIMQALVNGNSMVRLFGLSPEQVLSGINRYEVTNLSATPTFYRLLLGQSAVCPTVNRLTSGGEAFDAATLQRLQTIFPNAKITNVYASTEFGALFASEGRDFVVKNGLQHLIRVDDSELLVHKSLLGESMVVDGEWYRTGDVVEVLREEPMTLRFVSRKTDMINVGGYKVNPAEVEDVFRQHDSVRDVRVYAKANSVVGHIVCAEVVRSTHELNESLLRSFLSERLQEFKVPRMIRFVDALSTTRSGKVKRS